MASPTNFPVITSPPFGPTSYALPFFQPDAVLTAAQLNEWFSFVMAQQQATRTRLLGVGVATGLRPALDGTSISLSAGCGLTSEGHLLRLEAPQTYTGYEAYAAPTTNTALSKCTLLELRPAGQGGRPLSELTLSDYAVLLFQNSVVPPVDKCVALGCNDQGDVYDTKLQVLLVPTAQANRYLLNAGTAQAAVAYARLPVLALRRPVFTEASYPARLLALKEFLQRAAAAFGSTLTIAAGLVQSIDGFAQPAGEPVAAPGSMAVLNNALTFEGLSIRFSGETKAERSDAIRPSNRLAYVEEWRQRLVARVAELSNDANIQYVYDWLKDLYDAYEEFRQATASPAWLTQALPAASSFPRHLVLGELVPAADLHAPQCRHAWLPAPSSTPTPDAPARGLWLFRRIGSLITQFRPKPLPSSAGTSSTTAQAQLVRQVQEAMLINLLDQAAPKPPDGTEYQTPDIFVPSTAQQVASLLQNQAFTGSEAYKSFASLTNTTAGKVGLEDGIRVGGTSFDPFDTLPGVPDLRVVPDRARPAGFDERSLPFYYAPAMREAWSYARTSTYQTALILSYNAAANAPIQTVRPLEYQLEGYDFYRVEGLLDAPAASVLARLLALRKQYSLPFDVVAVCAEPLGTVQTALTPPNSQLFADQAIELKDLVQQLNGYAESKGYAAPPATLQLEMTIAAFRALVNGYLKSNLTMENDLLLVGRLNLLLELNRAYNARLASLNNQLSYSTFLAANPGLEHGAGVPRGGTLVLVYRTPTVATGTTSAAVPVVVGDYYLPYRQSGAGPVVQLEVLQPPALVSIAANPVAVNGDSVRLSVTPPGGSFDSIAVKTDGDDFYFKPTALPATVSRTAVSRYPLTYTTKDGTQRAQLAVVLFPDPRIENVLATVDAAGVATFTYQVFNATKVVMDFGDGSLSESFGLDVTPAQNGTADYISEFDTPTDFAHAYTGTTTRYARLTAVLGSRTVTVSVSVKFATVVPTFTGPAVIVVNQGGTLLGSPIGEGYYSSNTLVNSTDFGPLSQSKFVALEPGFHTAYYTLYATRQRLVHSLFALPDKLEALNREGSKPYFTFGPDTIDGSIVLPTPPDGIRYDWELGARELTVGKEYVPTPGDKDGITRYVMSIPVDSFAKPEQVPLLMLSIYDAGYGSASQMRDTQMRNTLVSNVPDIEKEFSVGLLKKLFVDLLGISYQTPDTNFPTRNPEA